MCARINIKYDVCEHWARRSFHGCQEEDIAYAITVMCICLMIPVRLCYSSVYVLGIRYIIKD
jgi:hypothetical protein